MSSKRFVAKSAREVMTQVRNELGPDANIISHREINGWHEITASHAPKIAVDESRQELEANEKQLLAKRAQDMLNLFNSKQDAREVKLDKKMNRENNSVLNSKDKEENLELLLSEIRNLKTSFQSQLKDLNWNGALPQNQTKNKLVSTFFDLGFNQDLITRIIKKMPMEMTYEDALLWSRDLLSKNIKCIESEEEILSQKGIYALVGPTGVGKTTTIAKIAARYSLINDKSSIGLVSTDTYRIGGNEQLRIYAKILGIEMLIAKDITELNIAIEKLSNKKLILIDMAGLSHKDRMVESQLQLLQDSKQTIKKILCLNANNTTDGLDAVVDAYSKKGLEGCIITKADEAITLGSAINTVMKNKLKVIYLTNGQRVPEDICLLNKTNELEMMLFQNEQNEGLTDVSNLSTDTHLVGSIATEVHAEKSLKNTIQFNA